MCRCIAHGPVPLAGLVFCETKEWNKRGVVKRTVNQHQNEPKPTNQTDQPINNNKKEKIIKQSTKQPISSPSCKYRN